MELTTAEVDALRAMSHEERVAWHYKRQRELEPVVRVLNSISTGLTPKEIETRLRRVRNDIKQVETAIILAGSTDFAEAKADLDHAVREVKKVMQERSRILMWLYKNRNKKPNGEVVKSEQLKELEQQRVLDAEAAEQKLCDVCESLGANPKNFRRVHELKPGA